MSPMCGCGSSRGMPLDRSDRPCGKPMRTIVYGLRRGERASIRRDENDRPQELVWHGGAIVDTKSVTVCDHCDATSVWPRRS